MRIWNIILAVTFSILLAIGVFSFGIYRLGWENSLTRNFLKIVPLPIMLVNGHFISFGTFEKYAAAMELMGSQEQIFDYLAENELYRAMARDYKIRPTAGEIENYFQYLVHETGLDPNLPFGMPAQQFQDLFVGPDYLQKLVQMRWLATNAANLSGFKKIKQAKAELELGTTFADAARIYSEDEESKFIGGDLGFLKLFALPIWTREEVSTLKQGEISPIVVSPQGFHIYLANRVLKDSQEIQLRQIFVNEPGFAEYLQGQKQSANIQIFQR